MISVGQNKRSAVPANASRRWQPADDHIKVTLKKSYAQIIRAFSPPGPLISVWVPLLACSVGLFISISIRQSLIYDVFCRLTLP